MRSTNERADGDDRTKGLPNLSAGPLTMLRKQDAAFHELHCKEQVPMREIARRHGIAASTVLRAIRRYEDREEAPPPPPPPVPPAHALPMRHVGRFLVTGKLTKRQALAALRFARDPEGWRKMLPPTMWEILNAIIVEESDIQTMEKDRGWPARSAKGIFAVLLDLLEEGIAGTTDDPEPAVKSATQREVDELREHIAFLTGNNHDLTSDLMVEFGLTPHQARMLAILHSNGTRVLSRETLHARLYETMYTDEEWPDLKVIDTIMCHLRKKLRGSRLQIETVWGMGYRLVVEPPD